MSDPVAQAAAQIAADAAPSSTEPSIIDEIKQGIHTLEEKVEHFIHPDSAAASGEAQATGESGNAAGGVSEAGQLAALTSAALAPTLASGDLPNAAATPPAGAVTPAPESDGEHPHTTILRNLTTTLRRKFNVFDSELETLLKDAESHL